MKTCDTEMNCACVKVRYTLYHSIYLAAESAEAASVLSSPRASLALFCVHRVQCGVTQGGFSGDGGGSRNIVSPSNGSQAWSAAAIVFQSFLVAFPLSSQHGFLQVK